MLVFYPAGKLMDRKGRQWVAVPSTLIMGTAMVLIPLSTGFVSLMLAALLIGFGNGISSGLNMTLGADFSPDNGQQFMYVSDGGNEIMWIFDHVANTILAGFGRPGHMAGRGRDGRWSARPEVRAPGQREIQGSRARLSGGRSHPPAAPLRSRQSELTSPSTAGRRTAPGRRSIGPSSAPRDFGGSGPNAGGGTRRFVAAS